MRAAQEGLTDALKHAPRARTQVLLRRDEDGVELELRTTGPTRSDAPGSGRGLRELAERLGAVGGRLEHGPVPGADWRLLARVPVRTSA